MRFIFVFLLWIIVWYDNRFFFQTKAIQKKKRILEPWTEAQKKVASSYFKENLKTKIPPKKNECLMLKEENPDIFSNKSWEKIKIYIVNEYKKMG